MQIKINDEIILEITQDYQDLLTYSLPLDSLEDEIKRRLIWIINEKLQGCKKRILRDWLPILKSELTSLPVSDDDIVALVMAHPEYKNRDARDALEIQLKQDMKSNE